MPAKRIVLDPDILYSTWASNGFTNHATSVALGVSQTHVRSELILNGFTKPKSAIDNSEITIDGSGRGLVLSDIHVPLTNYAELHKTIDHAIEIGATDYCVIAGDFLHQDSTSRFEDKQEDAGLETEREQAQRLAQRIDEVFTVVWYSRGNHDERFSFKLSGKVGFVASMRWLLGKDDLNVTARDYVLIDTPEGAWRACHTRQYSKSQLTVPSKIAERYRMNVIGGHRHHHAVGWSGSGYMIIENGGFHDVLRTQYLHTWSSDFPLHQIGCTFLLAGKPYLPYLSASPIVS